MIDTVKKAEDGLTLIVRLYEFGGMRTKAVVTVNPYLGRIRSAEETNLMEEHPVLLAANGQEIEVSLTAYEIKTLNIALSKKESRGILPS